MTGPKQTLDVDAAVPDPADQFESPMDIVRDSRLAKSDERRILESRVPDAELLSQGEAESMQGTERPRLQEARLALLEVQKQG